MAASFSWRSPLIDTVAIEVFTVPLLLCASAPTSVVRQAIGPCDEAQHHVHRVPTQACELLLCAEVASEDLGESRAVRDVEKAERTDLPVQLDRVDSRAKDDIGHAPLIDLGDVRSEEHTSEHKSLMSISSAVFCLKKKTIQKHTL